MQVLLSGYEHEVGGIACLIESVSVTSGENAAAIQQVSASSKQILSQRGMANDLATTLAEMARGEQQLLAKFTISGQSS
jgi:methyl-accepting chemotaxis protein